MIRIAAVVIALIVCAASLAASLGEARAVIGVVRLIPHGDVIAHFLLMSGLSFAAVIGFGRSASGRFLPRVAWIVLVLALVMTCDECVQLYLSRRTFSWWDLCANYAGITTGSLTAMGLMKGAGRRRRFSIRSGRGVASRV